MGNSIEEKLENYLAEMKKSTKHQQDKHKKNSKNYAYWNGQVELIETMEVDLFVLLDIPRGRR